MKILTRSIYDGGRTYWHSWDLISTRRWTLSWHRHTKSCRYGWYHNRTLFGGGLWVGLNLPFLGDFALWKYAPPRPCS